MDTTDDDDDNKVAVAMFVIAADATQYILPGTQREVYTGATKRPAIWIVSTRLRQPL